MASKAVGLLTFNFGANLGGFDRAMKKSQKKLRKFGKNVEKIGKSLSTNLTLPIVGLGAVSLKTFADFEQSMLKVKAISGATEAQFETLTQKAKELGSATMFTASQVAELQLNLSKLGLTPEEINKSTESILKLAQATDSDLGQAATVAAKTMNAFGLEAKDMNMIADVMADSFSSTALDMTKFETAMASVAPVAKQAGANIQETSAILGVLVNNGVEASTAGTALRNIFLDLAKNGMTWGQAMDEINNASDPLAAAMDLFGKRGANVATILAQSGVEIQNLTDDFIDSTGEAHRMAEIMDSGVAGSMRKMKSQLEGVAIEMGEHLVPIFKEVIKKIQSAVKWFGSLSDETKKNIVKWGLIVAAIGPFLLIVGKAILLFGQLKIAIAAVNAFLLANPYVALGAAIITLIGYFTDWFGLMDETELKMEDIVGTTQKIKDLNNQAFKSIAEDVKKIEDLTRVIEDETTALEDKEAALAELKKTSPQYYNQFDTIEGNINAITAATKNLTAALMNQAQAEYTGSKLTELYAELVNDLGGGLKGMSEMERLSKGLPLSSDGPSIAEKEKSGFYDRISLYNDLLRIQRKLIKQSEILQKNSGIDFTTGSVDLPTEDNGNGGGNGGGNSGGNSGDRKVKSIEAITHATKELKLELKDYNMELATAIPLEEVFDIEPVNKYRKVFGFFGGEIADFFGTTLPELESGLESMVNKLRDNLAQGAESFEEFGKTTLGVLRDVIGGLISQGVTAAITSAISGNPLLAANPWAIPLIAGAAAGLARTAFNSLIPQFAEGGLVTGPTLGLIGEGPGTNAGNPEVIAPLDKLKSMIGGGNQNIVVEGKLAGNDIFLSNARTKFNRNRTV